MAVEKKFKVIDPIGFHARPAGVVAKAASGFKCDSKISSNGKTGNMKSMMGIMALAIKTGAEIEIKCDGEDENDAIAAIEAAMKENKIV